MDILIRQKIALEFVASLIDIVAPGACRIETLHCHDHDFDALGSGKVFDFIGSRAIVFNKIGVFVFIERMEMASGLLERRNGALIDCDAWNHHYELPEAIAPFKLMDGSQVSIGFPSSGFHFDGKNQEIDRRAIGILKPQAFDGFERGI